MRAVDEWDWLSPVALSAEHPVPELEVYRLVTKSLFFEVGKHPLNGIGLVESVQEAAVDVDAVLCPGLGLHVHIALEDLDYRESKLLGELPVAGVVCRDCHDCARAV